MIIKIVQFQDIIIIRKLNIAMDSDKGNVNLINPSDMEEASDLEFPQFKKQISNPDNLNKTGMLQIDQPEILQLGGNKSLNKKLHKIRPKKLQLMKNETPIIQCFDLGKQYNLKGENPVVALKSVTLNGENTYGAIKKGEFVIIRGPSGGGKTTFLNILGTIDSATHGSLRIQGKEINSSSTDQELSKLRREKIGIVFQTFNLLALMSAYENIELPMRILGKLNQKQMKQRTKMLLRRVGLSERADHLPSQLSGGEQQRVAIARSLSNSPSIILLDEPTGDLDSKSTVQVMNLLLQINNFGYGQGNDHFDRLNPITIIMVTHNEDLECYGDRVIFFQDGKIRKQVLNQFQFALDAEQYSAYLNTKV